MSNGIDRPRGTSEREDAGHHILRIRRILEHRIVPSLILDPAKVIPPSAAGEDRGSMSDAVVAMALQGREDEARTELRALHSGGMTFSELQLGLLAPAAEKLGVLWDSDSISFVDVTVATGTLQRLMRFVAVDLFGEPLLKGKARSICVFSEPGASHSLGAAMAARFFEQSGWRVELVPSGDREALLEIVRRTEIDVLGLSLARSEHADAAAELLAELKSVSRNRRIVTIAGGAAVSRDPILMTRIGVDAVLAAIPRAPELAAALVARSRSNQG